jgi:hypothetical protein
MREIRSWWLGSRTVTDNDDALPVAFRQMPYHYQDDLAAVEGDLRPWLQLLDKAMESNDQISGKPREMLEKAMTNAAGAVGHKIKASDLLASDVFKDRRSASMPEAEDVVLTMFLWGSK